MFYQFYAAFWQEFWPMTQYRLVNQTIIYKCVHRPNTTLLMIFKSRTHLLQVHSHLSKKSWQIVSKTKQR